MGSYVQNLRLIVAFFCETGPCPLRISKMHKDFHRTDQPVRVKGIGGTHPQRCGNGNRVMSLSGIKMYTDT